MKKIKPQPKSPQITSSKLMQQWQDANAYAWSDRAKACATCPEDGNFKTGDVCFDMGDPKTGKDGEGNEVALIRGVFLCTTCGYHALVAGERPSGIAVFIQTEHQNMRIEELPAAVRARIEEAFQIVDALHQRLEELAAKMGQA